VAARAHDALVVIGAESAAEEEEEEESPVAEPSLVAAEPSPPVAEPSSLVASPVRSVAVLASLSVAGCDDTAALVVVLMPAGWRPHAATRAKVAIITVVAPIATRRRTRLRWARRRRAASCMETMMRVVPGTTLSLP